MDLLVITREAVERAGGDSALSRRLGITPQAVQQWKRVPAPHCIAVEELTAISRHLLRPDIYGPMERKKNPIERASVAARS